MKVQGINFSDQMGLFWEIIMFVYLFNKLFLLSSGDTKQSVSGWAQIPGSMQSL